MSESLSFQYVINGVELRLFSPTGFFEGLEATVAVSIFTIAPDFGFLCVWGNSPRRRKLCNGAGHGAARFFDFVDLLGLGAPLLSAVTVAVNEATVLLSDVVAFSFNEAKS